tara:strand:+ start:265 stop:486 length:222 start_codon:yes stop_codon:yes gene_type:complete
MKRQFKAKKRYVTLNSIGTILDNKTGMLHPQNIDGSADLNTGYYIEDTEDDFVKLLNREDLLKVLHYTAQFKF